MDRGAWQATVHGGAESQTLLKWFGTHEKTLEFYLEGSHWRVFKQQSNKISFTFLEDYSDIVEKAEFKASQTEGHELLW